MLRFSHRWEHVHIAFCPDPATHAPLRVLKPEDFPRLRSLSITNNSTQRGSNALLSFDDVFSCLTRAPQLTVLRIIGIPVEIDDLNLAINWATLVELQVQVLEARSFNCEHVLVVLAKCPRLKRLSIGPLRDRYSADPNTLPAHPIEAPSLETLDWFVFSSAIEPLAHILCPSLTSLSIRCSKSRRTTIPDLASLERFLANNNNLNATTLEHFHLSPCCNAAQIHRLIQQLPKSLRSLSIRDHEYPNVWDSGLDVLYLNEALLALLDAHFPNLRQLRFEDCFSISMPELRSWASNSSRLESLHVAFARHAKTEEERGWEAYFKELVDAGMDVRMDFVALPRSSANRGMPSSVFDSEQW
ncbi:F-box domain-containing protein [Mycena chlorophos]|uniref:F-box domain-containing protein n=1 Tax=Mycena chlorophos TaxID=658473 RepID=A0A8H6SI64_MYCCL|nr:F-box domain-containing protein [Mycena chlorophos]